MILTEADRMITIRGTIYRDVLHDPLISMLWESTRSVDNAMQELGEDERVSTMLRTMRRIRWHLTNVPLPSNHPQVDLARESGRFTEMARVVTKLVGSGTASEFSRLEEVLKEIETTPTRILFDRLCANLVECGDNEATVIVQDRAFIVPCTEALAAAGSPFGKVIRPEDMHDSAICTTQFIVGISRQLPDWMFTAPSAEIVTLVHFDVVRDRDMIHGLLNDTIHTEIRGDVPDPSLSVEFSPIEIARPERDWGLVRGRISGESHGGDALVPARAFVIASDRVIFLVCEDDETCRTVRIVGDRPLLKRVLVRDVTEGDYLIVRTDGGNRDVIADIADELLGQRAGHLRKLQVTWSSRLLSYIQENGRERSQADLRKLGCKARTMDSWARGTAIRPQSDTDFSAVLQLCGIEGPAVEPFFEGMQTLRSAHIRAGHYVSRALERRIAEVDVVELAKSGWMELRLEDSDVRPMGLFRVEDCEKNTTLTRISHVGVPTHLEVC